MNPLTSDKLQQTQALCVGHRVRQLDPFGSALAGDFDPARSDIDFVVDFEPGDPATLFDRYFGLKASLESLFGRSVDLVMAGAMCNPYFIESVNRSRRTVYASALASAA